jgi:DNA-binding NtrC family response regulator
LNSETYVDAAVDAVSEFGGMRTRAPRMREVFAVLGRLAKTSLTVTLIGETGSGKNRLARAVHAASSRRDGPLVVLDFELSSNGGSDGRAAEVEQGMFRARSLLPSTFEQAQGGTLLIDNASELSLELQGRLLPILENQRVHRDGTSPGLPFDFRLIVVSNCELEAEVAAGRFRRDLYFRLAAAVVRVPPLRERVEDVPLLVSDLLADIGQAHVRVAPEAIAFLQSRQWFGNVRELKNTLETTLALLDTDSIEFRTLERVGFAPESTPLDQLSLAGISLQQLEMTAIKQTLAQVRGNKVRAAKVLGIAVSTLYEKLKRLSLD